MAGAVMLEELVARVFSSRNIAQLSHWRAKGPGSYAKHVTLGEFYDDVIDRIDGIVEACQGSSGKLIGTVNLAARDGNFDMVALLKSDQEFVVKNKEKISGGVSAIDNLLDELSDLYLKTIYKLKNLS